MLTCVRRLSTGRRPARLAASLGVLLALSTPGLLVRPASAGHPDIYYIWRDGVRLADGVNPYGYDLPREPEERATKHPRTCPSSIWPSPARTSWESTTTRPGWHSGAPCGSPRTS
jgi:hypothetical protein